MNFSAVTAYIPGFRRPGRSRAGISLIELLVAVLLVGIIAATVYRFYVLASRESIMGRFKFVMNQRSQIFLESVKNDLRALFLDESRIDNNEYLDDMSGIFPDTGTVSGYQFSFFDMNSSSSHQTFKNVRYNLNNGVLRRQVDGKVTHTLGDRDDVVVDDFRIVHYRTAINIGSDTVISPHWFRIELKLARDSQQPLRDIGLTILTSVGPRQLNDKRNYPHWQALNQFLAP